MDKRHYYDSIQRTHINPQLKKESRHQVCFDYLPIGKRFLDVGCEYGTFTFLASSKFEECYGIDVSQVVIDKANEQKDLRSDSDKFKFIRFDVDDLIPFNDGYFDAIACMSLLEHVFDPPSVLAECRRVLKHSGFLIIEVPNIAWLFHRMTLLRGALPLTTGGPLEREWEHLHYYTLSSLASILHSCGFSYEFAACSGKLYKIRSRWPSLLGANIIIGSTKK